MEQDHAFLMFKNKGLSRAMRGKIAVDLVFVADRESMWTQKEVDAFYGTYKAAMQELCRQAAAVGVPLSFATTVGRILYKGSLHNGKLHDTMTAQVYRQYLEKQGFPSAAHYAAGRKATCQADEVATIFVLERAFRAYAMPGVDLEYCCLTEGNDVHAVMHEMLHLFGAVDLYHPYHVYGLTMSYFPKTVMCTLEGMEVDRLTQYLVGWKRTLSPKAKEFMDKLSDYTEKRFHEANTLENFRGREESLTQYASPFISLEELRKLSLQADPWAEFLMGLCYLEGIGVERDLAWAEAYFLLSGRSGLSIAAMLHAKLLICRGVQSDRDRENLHLLLNYNASSHIQFNSLRAACLITGYGGQKNPQWARKEAIRCYQESEAFQPYAKRSLGFYKVAEKLCSRLPKLKAAVAKLRREYETMLQPMDPNLEYLIALELESGEYAEQDLPGAFTLYQMSADNGCWLSCRALARCYRLGIGTARDPELARRWDAKAAACRAEHPLDAFCHVMQEL